MNITFNKSLSAKTTNGDGKTNQNLFSAKEKLIHTNKKKDTCLYYYYYTNYQR